MNQKHTLVAIAIQLERIANLMGEDMKSRGLSKEVEEINQNALETQEQYLRKFC